MTKPKRLARTVIYENPWVNLYVDKVAFPGGRIIEQHHILEFDKQDALAERLDREITVSMILPEQDLQTGAHSLSTVI